jgi:imidazole glycerol-phosphate synthase subunit HisH
MIGIINLGISNLTSVLNALKYINVKYFVINEPSEFEKADSLILPGVGTFESGMSSIRSKGFEILIKEDVLVNNKSILGICLGMQLFFASSEESKGIEGLNLLEGKVIKLPENKEYTMPRIGWAESICNKKFLGFEKEETHDFYYIHSYYAKLEDKEILSMTTGGNKITASVQKNNIIGCQFHPEKSHKAGLDILKEFAKQ